MTQRKEAKKWEDALAEVRDAVGGYRTPVRMCPRGCTHELARRDVVARTRFWGRVVVKVRFDFEIAACTRCGAALMERCGRCDQPILTPVRDRCYACGVPHPWADERQETARRSGPRRWLPEPGVRAPATLLFPAGAQPGPPATGALYAIEGDIVDLKVDAIVSNDDTDGRMWTAVASAIKRAAGPDVERQSVDGGPYPRGEAWSTDGGSLDHLKRIVHVATMDPWGNGADLNTIRSCIRSALDETRAHGLSSLAVPPIGTGPKAIPLKDWLPAIAEEIVAALRDEASARSGPPVSVLLVLHEPGRLHSDLEILRRAVNGGDEPRADRE